MSKFRNYALVGALGLAAVASAMQINFNDGKASEPAPKAIASLDEAEQPESASESASERSTAVEGSSSRLTPQAGSTVLEQAIFDSFGQDSHISKQAETRWRAAVDTLRSTITKAGYPCAVPYEAARIDSRLYGIGCKTDRSDALQTNYLLDVQSGKVEPL